MAGFDKEALFQRLTNLGWTERTIGGKFRMVPPSDLFTNAPDDFSIYDALDLQDLLTNTPGDEDPDRQGGPI